MRRVFTAAGLVVVALLAGCTSSAMPAAPSVTTSTSTVVRTRTTTASPSYTPAPAASVRPLEPGADAPKHSVDRSCPYIKSGLDEDDGGTNSLADLEGDRVYRTVVLTDRTPVGCRFYFYAPPYEATADILPTTFPTARAAHDALVLTARAGHIGQSLPDFVPGVDGISYQTTFFGPDGDRDWAFAFAKGRVLIVVHTQQDNVPLNAQLIARAVVGKF